MSERERARNRAQGALENFIEQMAKEIEDQSFLYQDEFWEALNDAMFHAMPGN